MTDGDGNPRVAGSGFVVNRSAPGSLAEPEERGVERYVTSKAGFFFRLAAICNTTIAQKATHTNQNLIRAFIPP
jgi:hypothetical protein